MNVKDLTSNDTSIEDQNTLHSSPVKKESDRLSIKSIVNNDVSKDGSSSLAKEQHVERELSVVPSEVTEDDIPESELPIPTSSNSPFLTVDNNNNASESDSTMSDLPEVANLKDDQESEVLDFDAEFESSPNETLCLWENCNESFDSVKLLNSHIIHSHIEVSNLKTCQWESCNETFPNTTSLIVHIRTHSKDSPYFCPIKECIERYTRPTDLLHHLKSNHPKSLGSSENEAKITWLTFLNESEHFKTSNDENDIKTALDRYNDIENDKQFKKTIQKRKIDFVKIQNVTIDDIVSEPIKKKGRTAASEINADLRGSYTEIDDAYKGHIATAARHSFKKKLDYEELPADEEINSIRSVDQLKSLEEELHRKYLWSLEVRKLLENDLERLSNEKDKLWNSKEVLLEANIELELPEQYEEYKL